MVSCLLQVVFLALTLNSSAQRNNLSIKKQLQARRDFDVAQQVHFKAVNDVAQGNGVQNITFSNPKASEFWVNGSAIPEIDWDIGPSWSGLLPISRNANETRKLFFWFFPPGPKGDLDVLNIWNNGGPGCSSLEGLIQENGPFSWSLGQAKPTVNEFSWTNLSSMLYVEQPVGTGFSQGVPNIKDEVDLAEQYTGFLVQFLEIFSELKGKKTYLTGESYAGTYIPYIADYIYSHPGLVNLSLEGTWMADPSLSWDVIQEQIPAVPFVRKFENVFAFNSSFMSYLDKTAAACNYTDYFDKYLTYPGKGVFPLPGNSTSADDGCDLWGDIFNAALLVNPAFNIYRVFDTYPILWDVLGFPGSFPVSQTPIYLDRIDVKKAIHAPLNTTWAKCSDIDVFPNGDGSLPPALSILPSVIAKNKRTVILHGLADYVLIAEGTRLVLQNMTWGGLQGFQSLPVKDSLIVEGMGVMGTVQTERSLTYYEINLSGHMIPQFSPKAGLQTLEWLMWKRDTP